MQKNDVDFLRSQLAKQINLAVPARADCHAAFSTVSRHIFLPDHDVQTVYQDDAVVTASEDVGGIVAHLSSSTQPTLMARMIEAGDIRNGHRVLEIGTGTGYNAAILAEIVGQKNVTTVDIDPVVVNRAKQSLASAGYTDVAVMVKDGWGPFVEKYDRILITAGVTGLSPNWMQALKGDGLITVPITFQCCSRVMVFRKHVNHFTSIGSISGSFMGLRGRHSCATKHMFDGMIITHAYMTDSNFEVIRELLSQVPEGNMVVHPDDYIAFCEYLGFCYPGSIFLQSNREASGAYQFAVIDTNIKEMVCISTGLCYGGIKLQHRLESEYSRWRELSRPLPDDLTVVVGPGAINLDNQELACRWSRPDGEYSFWLKKI